MKPTKTEWKFVFDFRVLSILLLIAVVPFLVGTWWLVSSYRESYLESHGNTLAEEAEMVFNSLNSYLENEVIKIAGLTVVPTLRETIEKSNLDLRVNSNEALRKVAAIEERWKSLNYQSPELRAVLGNAAADFLRRYARINSSYREIFVTDMIGRTVAATGKTSNFQHSKYPWWKEVYADGARGSIYIGDIHYHEESKNYMFDIAQPLFDPQGGVMGTIMVGIDAREIYSLIGSLRTSFEGTAALVRTDGSVVFAPGYNISDKQPFPAMKDIIKAKERGKRYLITQTKPEAILGLNLQGYRETYPHLNWILTISSPVSKVTGPLTELLRNMIILMLIVGLITILIALWLSREESKPILEEDAHFEKL